MTENNNQSAPAAGISEKSLLKRILKWAGIAVIAILVIIFAALFFIDHLAKTAVENIGPIVAKVPFSVRSMRISPLAGRVEIDHFEMGIPNGYSSKNSMMLGDVEADVDMSTLTSDKLVIEEVILRDIAVNYETPLTFTSSNIQDIINNINMTLGANQKQTGNIDDENSGNDADSDTGKKQQKLELDRLVIENVRLNVVFKQTGVMIPLIITLPELGPFGQDNDGLLPAEMVMTVSNAFYDALIKCVADSKDMLVKAYYESLASSKSAAAATVQSVKDAGSQAADAAGTAVRNIGYDATDATEKAVEAANDAVKDFFKSGKKLFK